jgi:hypothetical protein
MRCDCAASWIALTFARWPLICLKTGMNFCFSAIALYGPSPNFERIARSHPFRKNLYERPVFEKDESVAI